MRTVTLQVVNDGLLQAPIWEAHARGTNWLAVIDVSPSQPGGLSREFVPYGRGECLYAVGMVALFDALEFAADYRTTRDDRRPKRWYGVVVAKTEDSLLVEECKSGAAAVVRSREARTSPADKRRALEAELASHEARAAAIRLEIDSIAAPGPSVRDRTPPEQAEGEVLMRT